MNASADHKSRVKESLFQFMDKNLPGADLSVIDDIVLSYVISIIEEASVDSCFDVEGFIEMMAAYVPNFSELDADKVLSWVLDFDTELSRNEASKINGDQTVPDDDHFRITMQSISDMLPSINKTSSSRSTSESECSDRGASIDNMMGVWSEQFDQLQEMFPNSCAMEIKHCITIAEGDLERAAATLLHRREQGQALVPNSHHAARQVLIDDQEVKSRIIARYSYVDKNAETKEHKPTAPKMEPKKMVRYRDNKIVSLKGERYTEVSKNGEDEALKKPKKQHCP